MVDCGSQKEIIQSRDHISRVFHKACSHQAIVQQLLSYQSRHRGGVVFELVQTDDQWVVGVDFNRLRGEFLTLDTRSRIGLLLCREASHQDDVSVTREQMVRMDQAITYHHLHHTT